MTHRASMRELWLVVVMVVLSAYLAGVQSCWAQSCTVRLAVVFTPEDSGLLAEILPDFEEQTGCAVQVDSRNEVYDLAKEGGADLVISHYGHHGTEAFVTAGLGFWPRTVFANQSSLIGVSEDPARIRGLTDAVEAFRRIAQTKSFFIVNNGEAEKYLGEVLWEAAGRPDQTGWYIDQGFQGQRAAEEAARRGDYTVWGLVPFLVFRQQSGINMKAFNVADPLLQRIMVSVVVNPDKIPGVNVEGAEALEQYLIAQNTQARIRAFRFPAFPHHQMWWPAGRNNSAEFLMNLP